MTDLASAMPPQRILLSAYSCAPNRGSEPGVGWNWALVLAQQGHQVWVLTRENNRRAIEHELARAPHDTARLQFLFYDLPPWARWWKRDGRAVHAYYALWQRCILGVARAAHAKHRFDLVHHITFGVWRQPSLLHRLGIPFVFGPVGGGEMAPWALERGQSVKLLAVAALRATANWASLLNPWLRASLRRASLVVAKTPETAAWIARAGVPCATALEIGIDAAAIQPRSDPNDAPRGPLRCMFAGRLIGMKGVDLALQAVAKARARGADVTLTIVGRGPLQQRLGERAAALGVESSIAFIDWLSQPALFEQYRRHDVLLFPSLHDSSGNVVLEAFAHGLPVVCLALGGPGVMVDPSCGVAVAVHGLSRDEVSTALAQVLVEFAQDRTRVGRLARAARARALACTWQAAVRQTYARVAAVDGVDRRADA